LWHAANLSVKPGLKKAQELFMKIGIDAREIQDGVFTGIGRSLYDLVRYFEKTPGDDRMILFSAKPLPFTFTGMIETRVMKETWTWGWDQMRLPWAARQAGVDVLYSPYYKIPLWAPCPRVSAILDLIYLKYAEYRRRLSWPRRMYYATFGRWFAHAAARIVTSSAFSRNDILGVYGLDPARVRVIPLAVSPVYWLKEEADAGRIADVKKSLGIAGKYILYVGNFKPHKNVATLVRAFAMLAVAHDLQLVLAAPRNAGYKELFRLTIELGLGDRVVFTDTIRDIYRLRLLYTGAEVFVMPSLYEGFGLPPVEAMACGTPVVCSRAASLPEVGGDAALLVDGRVPEEMAGAISRLLSDGDFHRTCAARGREQAALFREDLVMPQMLAVLKEAAR